MFAPGLEQERVVLVLLIRFSDRLHHIFVRTWIEVPDTLRREVGQVKYCMLKSLDI